MEEVNWGIIGAGNVCEVKSGPAFQKINHSNLVAVMRRDGIKAKDFAERHQVPKWYSNADDLILDTDINAIYIATPPDTHAYYTLKAAKAGKHVYVEKPMALNYADCLSMIKACRDAEVKLFVAYYRRALPNILKIREIIQMGIIGEVRCVQIQLQKSMSPYPNSNEVQPNNWRINPKISGGGYFYDLASHQFDALDFILGPIKKAQGFAVNQSEQYAAEDLTVGSFQFENNILGHGVWAFNISQSSEIDRTTIIGSLGQLSFPFFGDHHIRLKLDRKPEELFNFSISKHIQFQLIQTVVNDILQKENCPSTGVSGSRTNWIMEQVCKRVDLK